MTKYKLNKKKVISYFATGVLTFALFAFYIFIALTQLIEANTLAPAMRWIIAVSIFICLNLINLIVLYFIYKGECYYFTEDSLVYEFNFIIKKKVNLPLNKINIINIKRNLIDIIFGGSKLCIGSGSVSTSLRPEITLYFAKDEAKQNEMLFEQISKKAKSGQTLTKADFETKHNVTKIERCIKLKKGDVMKMALTNGATYASLISIFVVAVFSLVIANVYIKFLTGQIVGYCMLSYFGFCILTLLISILVLWLKYYNFTASREGNNIKISYGLLSIKNYSMPYDKVHGVVTKENIIQRLFKLGSLQLCVVGIATATGNNNVQTTFLLPIGTIATLQQVKSKLLPEFDGDLQVAQRVCKKSRKHYFVIPNLWALAFAVPLTVGVCYLSGTYLVTFLPILILIICNIQFLLQYKNASIAIGKGFSQFVFGGFVKTTLHTKTNSIQEVKTEAGFIRRSENIATVKIVVRGCNGVSQNPCVRNVYNPQIDYA